MRIAINALPLDNQSAGIHYYVRGMLDGLHAIDHSHEIIIIRAHYSEEYPKFRTRIVRNIGWLPGWASLRLFVLIPWICRKERVEVVIEPAHFGPFNLPNRIKRVTIIHDLTPILFPQFHTYNGWFLQKLFLPGILKNADMILANSNHTLKDILTWRPAVKNNVSMIYPGIDELFQPSDDEDTLKRHQIKQPYLLYVGTIEPRKNLHLLLDAFTEVKKQHSDYQLVLVGQQGWKTNAFMKALNTHPYLSDIRLTGHCEREELPVFYSQARVTIYPSLYEGFGFPVVEALACGTPSLCLNHSSLSELASHDPMIHAVPEKDFTPKLLELVDQKRNTKRKWQLPRWDAFARQLLVQLENLVS
jgi:glycosyltransferase involved in cell wall biosynthesis